MRYVRFIVLVLALLVSGVGNADEEDKDHLEAGARIRIVAPAPQPVLGTPVFDEDSRERKETVSYISETDGAPRTYTRPGENVTGTLIQVTEDAIVLATEHSEKTISVPRTALTRLEVSERPGRKKRGAAIGALVGVGVALGFAAAIADEDELLGGFGISFATGAFLFVPTGVLAGVLIAPGERWTTVGSSQPGISVSFAIRF